MGSALDQDKTVPWSLILKIIRPTPESVVQLVTEAFSLSFAEIALFHEGYLWEREAKAYASLLGDLPGDLRAPKCFGTVQRSEDAHWLWLEDIGDVDTSQWSVADFARAAHALGTFNGAYLAGRPLPVEAWLNRRWLRIWSSLTPRVAIQVIQRPETWQQPTIQHAFPVPVAERLLRLWSDVPKLLDHLDVLPRTLCHHDAFRLNLLVDRNASREGPLVAVDWAYVGIGSVVLVSGANGTEEQPSWQSARYERASIPATGRDMAYPYRGRLPSMTRSRQANRLPATRVRRGTK